MPRQDRYCLAALRAQLLDHPVYAEVAIAPKERRFSGAVRRRMLVCRRDVRISASSAPREHGSLQAPLADRVPARMAPRHEHAKGAARSEPELVPEANPPLQADFRYHYQASISDGMLQIQRISGRRSRREKRGRKTYPHFNVRRHTHERVKLRHIIVSWSS
jgi:hypothetical protein